MRTKLLPLILFALAAMPIAPSIAQDAASRTGQSLAKDSRCFEMRTYYPAPGKFEALHARFRDHTNKLFVKHGMELVGYWVASEPDKGEKLVYILAHKSREAAKKSWDAFINDPEWKKARSESEANGKLVEKMETVFLTATDYSPIK
jgi:hypothetical protein